MLIRPPRNHEADALAAIELAARVAAEARWSPPPALQPRDLDAMARRWRARLESGPTRVAIVDTAPVGCVAWSAEPLPALYGPFVEPLHERTGIGRALVAVAMRRARLAGAEHMLMPIPAADPRARAFARALGFVVDDGTDTLVGSPAGLLRRLAILPAGLAPGGPKRPPD